MKLEELEKLIDAENLAKEDAKNNLPLTDSEDPDASESKIRLIIKELLMGKVKEINKLGGSLHTLLEQNKIKNEKRLEDTKTAPERFSTEASRLAERRLNYLDRAKKRLAKSEIDLREYQEKNKLENTEPDYPESQLLNIALFLLVLVIESTINATLFAEYLERGLLAGLAYALGFAFINLSGAVFFGTFAFRQLWNPSVSWKLLGGISCLLWFVLLLLGGNFLFATLRENLEIFMDKVIKTTWETWETLFTNAKPITHPGSWLLFLIGITFGVFAFIKSFYSDDRHPGYGRRHRKVEKFSDLVERITNVTNRELKKILDTYMHKLKIDEMYVQSGKTDNLKNHQKRSRLIKEFNNDFDLAKSNIEYFIKKYRAINSTERTDDPPKYFSKKIAPLEINFEEFRDFELEDYQIGDKEVFNKIKIKIGDEYGKICKKVAKKTNAK